MAEENPTLTPDPPQTPAEGTAEATAMATLAEKMTSAFGSGADDATPPVDGGGGMVKDEPTIESERVTDKTPDDSKEPVDEATPEPITLTERQKQGAKVLRMTEEELAGVDEATSKLMDEVGQKYQSAMGRIGNMVKSGKRTVDADADEEDPDGPDDETDEEDRTTEPQDFADLKDDYDTVDPDRLIQALRDERARTTDLETRLSSVTEQQEELLVDAFISTLDPDAFAHLGQGPTWRLDKASPEYKARKDMQEFASKYRLGAMVSENRHMTMLEALAHTTSNAEQIRDSALNKQMSNRTRAQRRSVHEPGRSRQAKSLSREEQAMEKLRATMDIAFKR